MSIVMIMVDQSTIQVKNNTKKNLDTFKEYPRETYDDVINKLMKITKAVEKELFVQRMSTALLSEKVLAKDWLSKKEDELWKDL